MPLPPRTTAPHLKSTFKKKYFCYVTHCFIYLFLAVLGLACCTWHLVLRDAESFLRPTGLVAPWHVGS